MFHAFNGLSAPRRSDHVVRLRIALAAVGLAMLAGLLAITASATALSIPPVRLQLKVSAEPRMKESLSGCLERELKSILPIHLVTDTPDYSLSVIALSVTLRSKREVGVAYSVVLTAPAERTLGTMVETHAATGTADELRSALEGLVRPIAHWVETAEPRDQPQLCRNVAIAFTEELLKTQKQ